MAEMPVELPYAGDTVSLWCAENEIEQLKATLRQQDEEIAELKRERNALRADAYEELGMVTGNNFAAMQQRAEKAESALSQLQAQVAELKEAHGAAIVDRNEYARDADKERTEANKRILELQAQVDQAQRENEALRKLIGPLEACIHLAEMDDFPAAITVARYKTLIAALKRAPRQTEEQNG